ncbi:hypothetical protein N9154_04200, partial [Akkermansiaceae bacterium]|nr:hypothetical protein [Akkermansiaceae bacterium]
IRQSVYQGSSCLRRVDAKIVLRDSGVWMLKRCSRHGVENVLLDDDIDYYRRSGVVSLKIPGQVNQYSAPASRNSSPYSKE